MTERVSFERQAIRRLRAALQDLEGVEHSLGMGAANRFQISEWELPLLQHFQFGDLRLEGRTATVVVEIESAGGLTNLVKYWPLLATGVTGKRFVLVHLFRVTSAGDYAAHRRLWAFLVERMRESLGERGVDSPQQWEARMYTYRSVEDIDEALPFMREALS